MDPFCPINVVPVDIYHCTGSQEQTEGDQQRVCVEDADIFVSDLFNHRYWIFRLFRFLKCLHFVFCDSVLDYGILKVLDHACKEFLKNDCLVIPSAVDVSAVVIDTTMFSIADFDFSCLNRYQWHLHHQKVSRKRYSFITLSLLFRSKQEHFQATFEHFPAAEN